MARILTLTSWYPPHHFGGYELSCHDVMTRLAGRGHEVRVLCGDEQIAGARPPDRDHESLVHRELLPHLLAGQPQRPGLRQCLSIERQNQRTLQRHLETFRPDVVSVWHMCAISTSLLRRLCDSGIPVVYVVCDDWPVYTRTTDPWASRFEGGLLRALGGRVVEATTGLATSPGNFTGQGAFCFVSQFTRRHVVTDRPWSYPLSTVVYSGIAAGEFPHGGRPDRADRVPGWNIVYAGRLDKWKGVDTLLQALPLLPPEATVTCYGRGAHEERTRLAKLAATLGVAHRVTFTSVERSELAARYAAADVVVFPSEWPEPFGLVPLEAMACGTPVVATAVGGSGEFLRDGVNCVLFPARDPIALAEAVHRLGSDAELRRRVVRGGLDTAAQFDADALADILEEWHVGAATRFAAGLPADRELRIPAAPDDDGAHGSEVAPAETGRLPEREVRAALEPVVARSTGFVLDVGTGIAPSVTASDRPVVRLLAPAAVDPAPTRSRDDGPAPAVLARTDALPFRSGAFGATIGDGRLFLDAASVDELVRVVRPDGRVALIAPNRADALLLRRRLLGRIRAGRPRRPSPFGAIAPAPALAPAALDRAVTGKLRVTARHPIGWSGGRKRRVASALVRRGPLRRLDSVIVLEAVPRGGQREARG